MSIEVKCNKCKSAYNVSDKLAGGSVRCAKCRSPIHVPIVRQRPQAPRAASAAEAAAEADAEYDFDYSPSPAPAAAAVSAPAEPPAPPPLPEPEPEPEPIPPAAGAAVEEPAPPAQEPPKKPRSGGSGKLAQRLKTLRSSDFDFRFRYYWSGSLARTLWVLAIAAAAFLGYTAVRSLSEAAQLPDAMRQLAEWSVYTRLCLIVGGLLLLRIGLEAVSALFSIAQLLGEVRDELRNRG
jgi:hypothetical protein